MELETIKRKKGPEKNVAARSVGDRQAEATFTQISADYRLKKFNEPHSKIRTLWLNMLQFSVLGRLFAGVSSTMEAISSMELGLVDVIRRAW